MKKNYIILFICVALVGHIQSSPYKVGDEVPVERLSAGTLINFKPGVLRAVRLEGNTFVVAKYLDREKKSERIIYNFLLKGKLRQFEGNDILALKYY